MLGAGAKPAAISSQFALGRIFPVKRARVHSTAADTCSGFDNASQVQQQQRLGGTTSEAAP